MNLNRFKKMYQINKINNNLIKNGKKKNALILNLTYSNSISNIFKAIILLKPTFSINIKKIRGKIFSVPCLINEQTRINTAVKLLIQSALLKRKGKFVENLKNELSETTNHISVSFKKKDFVNKLAEKNRIHATTKKKNYRNKII
uniref:Ribosomal protein S7 n=1 Tax=Cyanoptyche gloeocystis TaxID=77922 RepID=A0A096Y6Y5_9EUKA|nr:ribosomal protein S7 [Cyanoptyche gloeocystis]AIM52089.1 ribosomal protein S7 [Cyanoptyche gloeocystis]